MDIYFFITLLLMLYDENLHAKSMEGRTVLYYYAFFSMTC